jgi:hypothetical protein
MDVVDAALKRFRHPAPSENPILLRLCDVSGTHCPAIQTDRFFGQSDSAKPKA